MPSVVGFGGPREVSTHAHTLVSSPLPTFAAPTPTPKRLNRNNSPFGLDICLYVREKEILLRSYNQPPLTLINIIHSFSFHILGATIKCITSTPFPRYVRIYVSNGGHKEHHPNPIHSFAFESSLRRLTGKTIQAGIIERDLKIIVKLMFSSQNGAT